MACSITWLSRVGVVRAGLPIAKGHEQAGAAQLGGKVVGVVRGPDFGLPKQVAPQRVGVFEVAALAVQGLTAKAIGQRLHISERTVETHLAHAYAKLGVRSRWELVRSLPP
jgi:Bacterial regulatory proteins, luxR family